MLVIFDCDGVLVDSEAVANRVLQKHLAMLGLTFSPEEINQHFRGISMASVMSKIETEFLPRLAQKKLPADFEKALQTETFALFTQELQPVFGIKPVLEQLQRQGVRMCVASSGSHEKMAVTLQHTDLKKYFDNHIYSASEVAKGKPAPDLFLYAAQNMGVSAMNCVVIEDSLPGIHAALAAGMRALAYCDESSSEARRQTLKKLGAEPFSSMNILPILLELPC